MLNSNTSQTYLPALSLFGEEPGFLSFAPEFLQGKERQALFATNKASSQWAETCTVLTSQKSGQMLAEELSHVMDVVGGDEELSDQFVRFMDKQVGFGEVFDMLDDLAAA